METRSKGRHQAGKYVGAETWRAWTHSADGLEPMHVSYGGATQRCSAMTCKDAVKLRRVMRALESASKAYDAAIAE